MPKFKRWVEQLILEAGLTSGEKDRIFSSLYGDNYPHGGRPPTGGRRPRERKTTRNALKAGPITVGRPVGSRNRTIAAEALALKPTLRPPIPQTNAEALRYWLYLHGRPFDDAEFAKHRGVLNAMTRLAKR